MLKELICFRNKNNVMQSSSSLGEVGAFESLTEWKDAFDYSVPRSGGEDSSGQSFLMTFIHSPSLPHSPFTSN